ncbi:hypothetical protein [Chryseobacterium shigense]|uniref:Putative peptide modification target (TIGR04139 family) n=1 Tax=Chryseobacterium shigense TaxID=297244 RepID=A0A841N692_9FLAO|nr:hypothetical protein [Chryseobacterium shigense]MBB6368970.1 putative peptide modification target (TIGR04139 family) [Chryseobacterium shigense]
MKKLQGMKNGFSSLENKKLSNPGNIVGGKHDAESNLRTTQETAPNGNEGNTGDTRMYNDGVLVATLTID